MNSSSANPFSLAAKVGSLGGGVEASYRINPLFSVIGSVNGFKFSIGLSNRNVELNGNIPLFTTGVSLGIHPFNNNFKLLAGIFYNGNQFDLTSTLKHNVTLRGETFTPEQVGKVKVTDYFNKLSPYLGIGFDSPLHNESSWSFIGELGILFQGSPRAKLKRTGGGKVSPLIKDYIEKQAKHSADKLFLKYYPVLSIGMKYSF
ncbi:MAG: hypothetical protein K2W92_09465 [Alphaproteobacteria bacterium]|nr:hypothetical protein [Alphaproteobacteria bacterium]